MLLVATAELGETACLATLNRAVGLSVCLRGGGNRTTKCAFFFLAEPLSGEKQVKEVQPLHIAWSLYNYNIPRRERATCRVGSPLGLFPTVCFPTLSKPAAPPSSARLLGSLGLRFPERP